MAEDAIDSFLFITTKDFLFLIRVHILQSATAAPTLSKSEYLCPIIKTQSHESILSESIEATTRVRTLLLFSRPWDAPPKNS